MLTLVKHTSGIHPTGRPVRVEGRLTSTPATGYRIELFNSANCGAQGHGQGTRVLRAVTLDISNAGLCASNNCSADFSVWLSAADLPVGQVVTATATSPSGDTSRR